MFKESVSIGHTSPMPIPKKLQINQHILNYNVINRGGVHFKVLGRGLERQVLGLEASSPRKLPCPWLEDSTTFRIVKIL